MLVKDQVIIVSGIGPGLGVELALGAAREGAKAVVLAARTPAKLEDAAQRIADLGLGTETLSVPTDISKPEDCKNLVEQTVAKFGRIDSLINSAYVGGNFDSIETTDLDDWRNTMNVNLFGSLQLTQAAVPQMKAQGGGAVVMVNSMVQKKMLPYQGGYATSKGALSIATKALAVELGKYNIRVNSCYMGWMWGESVKGYIKGASEQQGIPEEQLLAGITQHIPIGRMPTDTECAGSCLFFCSDHARVITGAALDVNGGEYMP